ncbi:uncharacterized protein LOC111708145 isoform X3 [Eurytemora carolleeae]|uniref:uncharacterized protein LOC111708145 isoform X3 n=1 Tax=Eurytemora carolleeae TaxID=1294199 RepID=UPI000C77A16A|nr:uncharacterized protein LOC111708145 isoform X3 [Eurytemora carolleeae]|eukprot:XP_023337193.1 uncharacterized protein LOC111708145 isoform X3 [Eurytemora affinis]
MHWKFALLIIYQIPIICTQKPVVNSTAITSNLTKANLEGSKNPENVPKATHVNATLLLSPGNSTRANPRNITNTNLGNSTKPNPGNSTKSNLEQATNLNATLLNETKLVNVSSPKTRMNAGPRRTNVLIPQIISRSHGGLHNISNHRVCNSLSDVFDNCMAQVILAIRQCSDVNDFAEGNCSAHIILPGKTRPWQKKVPHKRKKKILHHRKRKCKSVDEVLRGECPTELIPNLKECNSVKDFAKENCRAELILDHKCQSVNELMKEECGAQILPSSECTSVDQFANGNCLAELLSDEPESLEQCQNIDDMMTGNCMVEIIPIKSKRQCNNTAQFANGACSAQLIPAVMCENTEDFARGTCAGQLLLGQICESLTEMSLGNCSTELLLANKCRDISEFSLGECAAETIPGYQGTCDDFTMLDERESCTASIIAVDKKCVWGQPCEKPNQEICRTCSSPVQVDHYTKLAPKSYCEGDLSLKTVHGLKCKVKNGTSSCMVGGEGYSFCDTEFLFFRAGHWQDWDLCSLCTETDRMTPLTAHGLSCDGECSSKWNNKEIASPRCRVKERLENDPEFDYCTTCDSTLDGGCANITQIDDRPGKDVKQFGFGDGVTVK